MQLDVLRPFDLEAGGLGLQIGGVVALIGVRATAVEFKDPLGDVVEEVAIMRDRDDRSGVLLEMLLEPLHALGVEMVGGLIKEQQVGLAQQQLAKRDASLLATGEQADVGISRRATQGVHGLLELSIEIPGAQVVNGLLQLAHLREQGVVVGVGQRELLRDRVEAIDHGLGLRDAVLDVLQNTPGLVELGLLEQNSDGEAVHQLGLAIGDLIEASHDLDQARLTGAIGADDADLRAGQERERDVVEDDLVAVCLTSLAQGIDELRHDR